ncbi:MAG: FAD-dependent oxidoreductase [Clostridia bacterium]|nr:FAD-dependent oxidoreductase [Clostridia bacterium]
MKKYDVAVIGGGFAGCAAALAAAREGAGVLLVEKSNALGGAPVNCLVNPFMPFSTKINGVRTKLSQGLFTTICDRLRKHGAMRYDTLHEEGLKYVLSQMMEEAGVDLLYHAYIFRAEKEEGKIKSISVATKKGEMKIEADYFVDASGDAQLTYLAGCPTILGRPEDSLCQPMTLCFRLGNVDVEKFIKSNKRMQAAYKKSLAKGAFLNPREDILFFRTPIHNVLHFNTTRVVKKNPTDPEDVTAAELLARKQVYEIYDFMKKNADGLEDSFLMMTAAEIGVRESRMVVGEYVLTEKDCRAFTKFDDSVAACNYDIDIHNPEGSGTSHYYFPEGEYYTIPYRSLIPQNMDNLLVAGRCISSDHGAQASYRIMPTVCSIGEAAGVAIALAAKSNKSVREISVSELQKTLKNNGAFIGI